jgi:hypothetical protein
VAFSPDGRSFLTSDPDFWKGEGDARLWDAPVPVEGEVERLVLWVQVLTRLELDRGGAARRLDDVTWQDRRSRLEELGGPPP